MENQEKTIAQCVSCGAIETISGWKDKKIPLGKIQVYAGKICPSCRPGPQE